MYSNDNITFKQEQSLLNHQNWQDTVTVLELEGCQLYYDKDDWEEDLETLALFDEKENSRWRRLFQTPHRFFIWLALVNMSYCHSYLEIYWYSKAVYQELTDKNTPDTIQQYFLSPPDWIEICDVKRVHDDNSLVHLDQGEIEAILLAKQKQADLFGWKERTLNRERWRFNRYGCVRCLRTRQSSTKSQFTISHWKTFTNEY